MSTTVKRPDEYAVTYAYWPETATAVAPDRSVESLAIPDNVGPAARADGVTRASARIESIANRAQPFAERRREGRAFGIRSMITLRRAFRAL
jgi:hypothetical protein